MSVIIANIIILFASVAFLIVKAAWQVILPICLLILAYMVENRFWEWKFYKYFSSWRALILQKIPDFLEKIPFLKIIYICFSVVIGGFLFVLFIALCTQLFNIIFGQPQNTISTIDSNFALAFLGTVSGGVALFTGYMAILRSGTNERETRTAEEGLITDRLNKATEGLGKKNGEEPLIEVRLGSLYALERIAQDSIRDHISVMNILCSYIRINSPISDERIKLREDITEAINIIGRRGKWLDGKKRLKIEHNQNYSLKLPNCNLGSIYLAESNFYGAHFSDTNLSGTFLNYADLRMVQFDDADLTETSLSNAKTDAIFIYSGDISKCRNLTKKQLAKMYCGKGVKIPKNWKRPEHWPKTKISWDEFDKLYQKWLEETYPEFVTEED